VVFWQMVNESFDTTTNRAGDKVNLPSNPFPIAKQISEEASSAGRASTGSAGQPQYAQVQNPFQNAASIESPAQQQSQVSASGKKGTNFLMHVWRYWQPPSHQDARVSPRQMKRCHARSSISTRRQRAPGQQSSTVQPPLSSHQLQLFPKLP